MLLTVDLGNTSLKLGVFDEDKLVAFACFDEQVNDYRNLILSFLFKSNLRQDDIKDAIYSCVVPAVYEKMYVALSSIVTGRVIDIVQNKDYGIKLAVPSPDEVGDDLVVMSAYSYHLHPKEHILVSLGTCTVVIHITDKGEFKHCIIAPGFSSFGQAIWKSSAMLPEFEVSKKNSFLANTTVDAMNVGTYSGFIGMAAFLVAGLKKDIGNENCPVYGCGGQGKQVISYISFFDDYDPDLVTKGLNYIYNKYEKWTRLS